MKTLLAATAVAIAGLVGFSPQAEAGLEITIGFGQTYVTGHANCGCPIYTRRVCRGVDRYRRPVFDYHRQPFRCGCKHKKHKSSKYDKHYKHYKPKYDKRYKSYKKGKKKHK